MLGRPTFHACVSVASRAMTHVINDFVFGNNNTAAGFSTEQRTCCCDLGLLGFVVRDKFRWKGSPQDFERERNAAALRWKSLAGLEGALDVRSKALIAVTMLAHSSERIQNTLIAAGSADQLFVACASL